VVFLGLAAAFAIVAPAMFFVHVQSSGLEFAKQYAAEWAGVVRQVHERTGTWPSTLQDAAAMHPAPRLDLPWPYLAFCEGTVCDRVGRYLVVYRVANGTPRLTVVRRDIVFEWDWSSSRWRAAQ
jgi:hypothetical protein